MKKHFTLIELPVVTSQLCRDFFKRFICTDQYGCVRKHTESAALKNTPHHTCKASASCLPQANASCSNAALHTAEPCFIRSAFTLIELLVSTVISSWHFFAQKSAVATQQRIPLFLKEKGGAGERENFFSREKKFSLVPRTLIYFDRIAGRYCDHCNSGSNSASGSQLCAGTRTNRQLR